jgi:gliding motility-associated-like protein
MYKVIFSFLLVVIVGYSYGQAPLNDKCANAIAVSPSSDCVPVNGTLSGATVDPGYSLNDVWFSFVATATSHAVSVVKTKDIIGAKVFKPDFQLYDACGGVVINSLPFDNTTVGNVPNPQNRLERTYTGLVIGKTYYYRVFNVGGGTEFEFNTSVCTFKSLGDVNDLVGNAIELPVSQTCNFSLYTLSKSTKSNPEKLISAVTNATWQFSDVWFKAKVPANGRISVILQNVGIDGLEALALYTSPDNGVTLNEVGSDYSSGALTLDRSGLTPNTYVYIRVCATSVNALLGTFNICVSTPPECGSHIPAGDNCSAPTRICDLNGYCGNTSSSYTIDLPSGTYQQHAVYGGASIENNSWLSFIASETSAKFTIYVSNCKAGKGGNILGIQAGVYEGNCTSIVPKSNFWSSPNMDNTVLNATNLTVGNEYYIMIDGNLGATCDYTLATNSGVLMVDAGPDQIYCNPNTNPLELKAIGTGTSTLTWSSRAGTSYTPTIGTTANLSLNPGPIVDTRYIVEATGTCTGTKDSLLVTISNCLCVKPIINSHPIPITSCPGSTINFSMSVTGATSYTWKVSKDGGVSYSDVSNIGIFSGANSATLVLTGVTAEYNNYQFKCIIKDVTGLCSDSTNPAQLTITPLNTITTSSVHVCKGVYTTLTATNAPSVNNTYKWVVPAGAINPGNVNSFLATVPGDYVCNIFTPSNLLCNSDFENYTSTAIFVNTNIATNCWQTTATDNKIEIWTTNPAPYSGTKYIELNATQQSTLFQKINLNAGSTLDVSFAHRGRQGIDSVKVMIGLVGGVSTKLGVFGTGTTAWKVYNVSYTVPTTGQYSLQFVSQYATPDKTYGNFLDAVSVKTGVCAVATSKITLINDPLPLATKSNDLVVCKGDANASLVFTGSAGTPNYTFTYNVDGGTNQTVVSSGNGATITANTSKEGVFKYFLVDVKDNNNCRTDLKDSVLVKIDSASIGGTVSSNHTVCIGSPSNQLTLSGKTGLITKWQYAISPFTTWIDTAILTSTFTSGPIYQSTKFIAVVKSGTCPEAYSTQVLVTVDPKSIAGTLGSSTAICAGQTGGNLTLVGNSNTILKWQSATKPFILWNDIVNTLNSYATPVLNDTTKFRVLVKSGVCPPDTSNLVTIAVMPKQVLNLQCGNRTNNSVQFTWDKIKNATNYTFNYTIDNTGTAVTGTISATTLDTTITVSGMGKTVNFTLTPIGGYCTGPETANCISTTCVTPKTDQLTDIIVCAGDNVDIPVFTSVDSPESFSWTNSNSAIGLPIYGISDTLFKTALVTQQEIGIIKVNAFKNPCKGPTMTFKITVNPLPTISTKLDTSICKGASITLKGNGGTSYLWDNGIQDNIAFAPTSTNTYKVIGTDVNTCKNASAVKITVNNLPSITVTNSGPICANDSIFSLVQNGDVLTKWSWKSDANALFSDSLIKQPVVKKAINNEVFTLSGYDVNGCKASSSTTFTISPLPIFNLASSSPCEKQALSIYCSTASAQSYAWTHKNGFTSTLQNPIISSAQLSDSGYYYLKFTDSKGCYKIDSIFVSVKPLPIFTPSAISPCETTPFSVKANYLNAITYLWTGPVTLANMETVLVSNTATPSTHDGDYNVTVTDAKGCSDTKKVRVTVKPSPVISVSNNGPLCANDTTLRLNQSGDVLSKWSWKSSNTAVFNDSLVQQPRIKNAISGEVFTLKGMDANGCSAIATTSVIINSLPVFSVTANTPCALAALNLSTDFVGAKSYDWSHNNGFLNTTQNPSIPSVSRSDSGRYSLKVTDVNLCSDTHSVFVRINELPVFSPNYIVPCENKPLILKANYTSTKTVLSYLWTGPASLVSVIPPVANTTITLKSIPAVHTGEYGLTITDENNCSAMQKFTITINPLPQVKTAADFSICIGDEVILKGTGALTYFWDNNIQDNSSFKPQLSANYSVKGLDVNLCENFDSVFVTVNPLPSITVPDLCESYKTVFTSNHLPATSNAWISSDIAIASVNPSTGEAQGLTAGKSTITFMDNVGCKIAKELVVNATPAITTLPLGVCENSQLILKANQTPAATNPWKSTSNNLTINSVSGQVFGLKAGVDSVSFTNNKGCKTTKLFTIHGLPFANFSSIKEICIDDTLRLLNTTSPLCENYVWDFGDGIKSSKANHKYSKNGFFTISLTAIDSYGCQDSIVKLDYVEVVNKPYVSFVFTPDSIDILNPEVRFKTNSDGKYFKWNFGDGKPTSITKDAIHFFPTDEGKYYTVSLTASNTKEGCSNVYTQVIVSKEPLIYYIPNTFTPNGDEFNNTFKPIFSSGLDPYNYTLFIYDRWGELIFESHNAQIGWDGTYNNQLIGSNTYIWKLNFKEKQNGQEHTKLGHVNVIR